LQTIAGRLENQNGITSSAYVASIFYQLVDGSAANTTWVGGAQSSTQLGDLFVGTTSAHLNELIGEWFLGTDMPMPQLYGSATKPAINATYQAFNIPLFGPTGTPKAGDIAQGPLGDGELLASLTDVLDNHPDLIRSMFVDDGNGVYGVRFYVNGAETWVTVNSQLPVNDGSLAYNNAHTGNVTGGLWADLIEKAYAQLSSDGNLGVEGADNAYYSINGGQAYYTLTNLTNASEILTLESTSPNWSGYKTAIVAALNAHDDVVLESYGATTNSSGQQLLVDDHPYSVIGYDAETGDFIVRNPWGDTGGAQTYVTQFEVSMNDVAGVKGDFAIDNSAAPNVVLINSNQLAWQTGVTNAFYWRGATIPSIPSGSSVQLASLFHSVDTAGLVISQYMIQTLGDGTLQLNGATDLATAGQHAAGEVVVSAADLPKLLLSGGAAAGSLEVLVSGTDGIGWSIPTDIAVTVDTAPVDVIPSVVTILSSISSAVSIEGLFKLIGADADASGLLYEISIAGGYGEIYLNGATNLDPSAYTTFTSQAKVSAADLSKLTYMAMSMTSVLNIEVYDGASTSSLSQIPIELGYSAAALLKDFDNGFSGGESAVADTAANIFASLDQLEQMMPNGDLLGITLTDSSVPTETITPTQLAADRGVLSIIESNLVLDVTASGASQAIDGLSNLATVVVFSGTASQYALSEPGSGMVDVAGSSGTTAISDVMALQFSDRTLTVAATNSLAEDVALLYQGALARSPDPAGLLNWVKLANALPASEQAMGAYALSDVSGNYNGALSIAGGFTNSAEFEAKYGSLTNAQFVTQLYSNILDRAPDPGDYASWMAELSAGQSREHVLVGFADSAEAISNAVNGFVGQSGTHAAWLILT